MPPPKMHIKDFGDRSTGIKDAAIAAQDTASAAQKVASGANETKIKSKQKKKETHALAEIGMKPMRQ